MTQKQGNSVLRRKVGARPLAVAPADPDTASHLSRALARATSRVPGLVGSCGAPTLRTAPLAELLDLIEGDAFVALISDPSGAVGLAIIDPVATIALVEAQTIGRLSRTPPPPRRVTQTDALLLSELIDLALAEFDSHAGASARHRVGYRFQQFPSDYRLLDLLLDAPHFDLIVQPLALLDADIRRDGQFLLALPKPTTPEATGRPAVSTSGRRVTTERRADEWTRAMEAQVLASPAQLTAVLGRVTMPLAEVMRLGIGSRVQLPLANLEEVEIKALDGQVLGQGRLGQFRAMRAVRLLDVGAERPSDPEFEEHKGPGSPEVAAPVVHALSPPEPT